MSLNGNALDSNSHSGSSTSSSTQGLIIFQGDTNKDPDLTLFGSPAPTKLSRTGTVRRVGSFRKESKSVSNEDILTFKSMSPDSHPPERLRKSLDSTYRRSLESISEYKTKSSFSICSLYPSRDYSSMDSPSSDITDVATRSSTDAAREDNKTLISPGSSYLSWIESVNSEYFGARTNVDVSEADNKVGEWNNFWLNYQSSRSMNATSIYRSASQDDRTAEELSDAKSTCSTHREFTDKNSSDCISLSMEDVNEMLKCSQRITEILQNALKKNDTDVDNSKGSIYSQSFSQQNSVKEEAPAQRERSFTYVVQPQELQRQKQFLKPTPQQSSSTSCINALLSTGVADMLKRVINKRRESMEPTEEPSSARPSITRSSFSDWSTTNNN